MSDLTGRAQLRISEFMAANSSTLADEDGAFEDWIEIQKTSLETSDLFDWLLTYKAGNLEAASESLSSRFSALSRRSSPPKDDF